MGKDADRKIQESVNVTREGSPVQGFTRLKPSRRAPFDAKYAHDKEENPDFKDSVARGGHFTRPSNAER